MSDSNQEPIQIQKQKVILRKWICKNIKKTVAKLEELQNTLQRSQQWQEIAHEGVLIQTHLYRWKKGVTTLVVEDWLKGGAEREILLNPLLSASEEIKKRMRESKKSHLAIPHLEREISKCQNRHRELLRQMELSEQVDDPEEFIQLFSHLMPKVGQPPERKKREAARTLPYREYWSANGIRIWVGKKACDNDKLTFCLANGSDFWLHISEAPGSHVIIRSPKGSELDEDTLKDALQLALTHSKAQKRGQAEVILTQCKYVSRLKGGAPGKVQVSKHQKLHVNFSKERLEKVKSRKDPTPVSS